MKKLLISFLILLNIFGCNRTLDSRHRKIQRIISLAPAATEIICALGKEKNLIAVTNDCNYPLFVKKKPKIGPFGYPVLEKIVDLNPDVVVATDFSKHPIIKNLNRLGVKVLNLENTNINELLYNILIIGKKINAKEESVSLVKSIKGSINKYKKSRKKNKPKIFIEIWGNPLFTAGGKSYLGELINIAGGRNITGYIMENYPQIREEIVLKENPEIIILTYKGKTKVLSRSKWQGIDAVRLKRVYDDIDYDILQRPGPRITVALSKLSSIIKRN